MTFWCSWESGIEGLHAFVILMCSSWMDMNRLHRWRDLRVVMWLMDWESTASWAWQLYVPNETIKTQVVQTLLLLPGLRLEKHTGTGRGCLLGQSSVYLNSPFPLIAAGETKVSSVTEWNITQTSFDTTKYKQKTKKKEQQINRTAHEQARDDWKKG